VDREDEMTRMKKLACIFCFVFFAVSGLMTTNLLAIDSELTRQTLIGLKGVSVAVENPQSNIEKYAQRYGLTREQIQKDVERRLVKAGVTVLDQEQWKKTPGRPVVYININTHLYQKYWYSYTVSVELRQIVTLEANPNVKTLADTWSVDMAAVANIGTLGTIKDNVNILTDRFIEVWRSVNRKETQSTK